MGQVDGNGDPVIPDDFTCFIWFGGYVQIDIAVYCIQPGVKVTPLVLSPLER